MKKIYFLWSLLGLLTLQLGWAQTNISGTVNDETGAPLPGATVIIEGTSIGVATDFDGNFSIEASQGETLLITYVGYSDQRITVGSEDSYVINMSIDNELEEVVVTAFGITREKKELGYAITTLESESIEQRAEGDVARILNGKIAGVNITNSNGLSGSATNIIIRGYTSATQSNQPLFIVDGIPFNSDVNSQSNFLDNASESNRFLDLDPNSIESVSVLKGLSATVLYGNRGRNGVILITTKNASSNATTKKNEISINQSLFFSDAILPDYQNEYGGGFHQGYGYFFSNWGPRFDRQDDDGVGNAAQYTGNDTSDGFAILQHPFNFIGDKSLIAGFDDELNANYEYRPYDGVKDFFRTGTVITTSINIRGSGNNTNYNINYGRIQDEGITRGNQVSRNNFGLGGNAKLSNKFSASGVFNFSNTDFKSPPNAASFGSGTSFDGSGIFGDVLYTPRSVDLTNIPFQAADGRSVYYRSGNDIQNPYWTIKNAITKQATNRFFGNLGLSYELNDWARMSYRLGLDTYDEANEYGQNRGGVDGDVTGIYRTTSIRNTIWDHNFLLNINRDLTADLNLSANVGFNARRDTFNRDGLESTGQLVFGILRHFNFNTNSAINSFSGNNIAFSDEENQTGVYADLTFSFKDFLFFNAVGRNDWSSTLEKSNNSVFYPGGSISFIPTSAFEDLESDVLNYLKVRVGYGSSAGFPGPFNTRNTLSLSARSLVDLNGNVISSNSVNNTLGNPDLKPERIGEFEIGIDTRLFNRLNFNLSLYKKTTRDLITSRTLDDSTGFDNTLINIGEIESKGIEIDYDITIFRALDKNNLHFSIAGNYTANETTVTDLAEGTENILLTSAVIGEAANYAVEGRPFGVLLGTTILLNDNGERVVGNNGRYLINNNPTEIGDPNPDWTTAIIPTFRYKNFTLNANVQYRHGGDIYSTTAATLIGRGVVSNGIDRESNYILPGVLQSGETNNIAITSTNIGFHHYFGGANEIQIFDGTTLRLQEVSLGYDFDQKLIDKTPFGSISLNLVGNNLWYKAFNFPENINYDTNASSTGVGNGQGIDFITGPSSRRYGLSLKATF